MRKKLVALFSAAVMVITVMCSAFPVAAAAEEMLMETRANKATVKPGDTVTVDLMITQNPGAASVQTVAVYDKEAFEIISAEGVDLFSTIQFNGPRPDDKSKMWWFNAMAGGDSTEIGKLCSVTFKYNNNFDDFEFYFYFTTWGDSIYNWDEIDVPCTIEKTTVKVSDGRSDDATLKSLTVSKGTLDPAFSADIADYTVTLPYGSSIPKVTAVKNDAKAVINTVQATSFEDGENKATVTVTAEKGNTKTYTVTFVEINAMLSALKVNGTSVTGFDPNTTTYAYEVSYADWNADKTKTYEIEATPSKGTSTVAVAENDFVLSSGDPDQNSEKNVNITVTSEQGDTTVYTIKFVVLACQHDYVIDAAKSTPATCTNEGEDVSVCCICGKEKQETVAALGHDWSAEWTVVTDATCEQDGSEEKTCARGCGEKQTRAINKLGHAWSSWTNVEGTEDYERICAHGIKCDLGGRQVKTVHSEEEGHTHNFNGEVEILKQPTCTEKGIKRTWCSDVTCAGHVDEEIDMIAHTESENITPATCTEPGLKLVTCSVCGTELERTPLNPLGHDFNEGIWKNDESGHWHECTRCGTASDKEAHNENAGEITTPATSYSNGIKTYSCTICGYVMRTEIIPATGADDNLFSGSTGGYVGTPIIPFGGIKNNESITVSVKNIITGKTSNARAKINGNKVTVNLGRDNDGNYANIYTIDDEYIYSALIENGKAKFNISEGVKFKVVIDSSAYGEDVSSAASAKAKETEISLGETMICLTTFTLIMSIAAALIVKKRAK